MFTCLVIARAHAFALPSAGAEWPALRRSLAALVPLAVREIAADAVLVGPDRPELRELADEAGCYFAYGEDQAAALAMALALARRPWLFALCAGYAPGAGFADEAADAVHHAEGGRLRAAAGNWRERIAPALAPLAGAILRAPTHWHGDLAALLRLARRAPVLRGAAHRLI